ncbi:neuroblast differentiation-associated protein AHNAK-like [Mucor ambiguus]|uniref:Neuroblast differentiation-associated protein AHNAK-like n=1 Tax=Mucor ambiguus TaxID=91626 RepID=A0A0C9MR64_9FUNG|nr:neuroblast differentiation-associated protein AHNAK-like [Mucor ambiguus]
MSQPILNALNNAQEHLNQFKILDKDHLGYLNVAQVKDYFESQQLPQDDLMALASRSNQGHLTPEQFASVINLSELKKNGGVGYHSSKFSSLSRHCEEAMEIFQKDRRMKVPSNDSKDKLLKAFKALEDFAKQFIQSLDDEPQDNDSLNGIIAPSTFEKMPGTFDFGNASSDNITSPELSMEIAPAAAPVCLKDPFLNDIPESPYARQNEKDPVLDSPSPLPQMNDAADAFMSGGLKPISNRNLNGDDAKPNNAHENNTWRSSVLDSLRNATMNDTMVDDDDNDGSREKEILSEEEPHERAIPSTSSDRGMTSNISTHAIEDSFKPSAIPLSSLNKESSDDGSTMEPISSISGPRDMNAEEALAASVAIVAAAAALSDNSKSNSHSAANPLDSATTTKSYTPETFQGGLGGASSEPFIKNAKDTELKPEDQPSFEARQAKSSMFNGTDDDSVARMDTATSVTRSALPKIDESNQLESESKPFGREAFQGGLGGDGTEPYIKNEKDTSLKPEEQPSFGASEQERMRKLNSADQQQVELNDMEQPQVNKTFTNKGLMLVPESFQGDLNSDASEPYIKNNKNTLLRPEGQPLFDAEQEKLRGSSKADNENESVDELMQVDKDAESSSSLGLALSKIGAGAAGTAGAAALGLFEHQNANDKNKDRSSTFHPSNNASDHDLASPRNVYSPSLTSDNSLEDAIPSTVISNEALDNIADKVDADLEHNGPHDDSFTTNSNDAISSDALDRINDDLEDKDITGSAFMDGSPHKDFCVFVEQETSLPPNIGNEVDIKTTNNDSNRLPITEKSSLPAAVSGNNDSTTASPGLNNEYIGGYSVMPESSYRASPATNTAESHSLPLDATNTPSVSSSSHSLTPNDAIRNSSSIVFTQDGADNKEEKPGFFQRLFGATPKSPESAASSIPDGLDKVASNGPTSPSADSKDSSISAGAPILDKVDAFNVNVPQAAVDVNADSLNDMSLNVHGADGSLVSSKFNANMPVNPHAETPDDFTHDTDKPYAALDAPKIDRDMNTNVDASGLSLSLEKSPADMKGLPDNVSGNFGSSVGFPNVGAKPASLDAKLSGPHVDLPDVGDKLGSSVKSPDVNAMLPLLNADANADPTDLSGSLVKLSSSLKDLGTDISDKISDSMNTRSIRGESPSLNTGLKKPNVELPNIDGELPSVDADLKTFNLDKPSLDGSFNTPDVDGMLPSVNTDFSAPNLDLPNISGKLSRSISAPSVDRDIKLPDSNANVNMAGSNLSGSLGKLSVGLKDIKEDISSKFEDSIDSPNVDGEPPNVDVKMNADADLPPIDGKVSSSSCDLETPKLGKPSADGKLTSSMDTSALEGKLPSLDADLKKLDRSISAPDINNDAKSPSFDADLNTDASDLPGPLGKLSAGQKGLNNDISEKLDGSLESPNIDSKAPIFGTGIKGSSADLPNVNDALDSSIEGLEIDGRLHYLSSDIKAPSVDMPSVDGKLPSADDKLKSQACDANVKVEHPESSGSLGKFSSSFKDLKDITSSKLYGETPTVDGEAPSLNVDLKKPELPDVYKKLPHLDTDLSSPKLDKPFLDKLSTGHKSLKSDISGKRDGSIGTRDSDEKLPAVDANLKEPVVISLPSVGDKFDGSLKTPGMGDNLPSLNSDLKSLDADLPNVDTDLNGSVGTLDANAKPFSLDDSLKNPNANLGTDVGASRPSPSGSLDKLPSGFKDLKKDISGKLGGSVDAHDSDGKLSTLDADMKYRDVQLPDINKELPSLDADMKPRNIELPDVNKKLPSLNAAPKLEKSSLDGKFDGILNTPNLEGKLSSLNNDIEDPAVELSSLSGELDGSMGTPDINTKFHSIESDLKTPDVIVDENVDASSPSLSGLGTLSSSFKNLKDSISGKFDGSADTPHVSGELPALDTDLPDPSGKITVLNTDLSSVKLGMPSIDGKLSNYMDPSTADAKLPALDADLKKSDVDLPHVSGKLDRSTGTPDMNDKLPSIEGGLKSPKMEANADLNPERPNLSGALGKLSSSFKGLKNDITGVFSGPADAPAVDSELSPVNTDYNSPTLGLPDADLGLDNSIDTPMKSGDTFSKDAELHSPHFKFPGGCIDGNASIKSPDMDAELLQLDKNLQKSIDGSLPRVNTNLEGDMTVPEADVDVSDLHSPNLNASADGSTSAPIASLRKAEPSGSLGKIGAGLTTPKNGADVPQVDAHTVVPVAPPRSPHLSLNKLPSDAHLDGSSNEDVNAPEASSRFNNPTFNVHVNGEPALEGDLSTGLHRTASGKDADKTNDEVSSSSFFSKPMEKISGAINSLVRDGDDDGAQGNNKTASGYTHPKTRLRTESPKDLSDMLDGIVKRRFSNTPSESDVSSLKTDKMTNKKSASGKAGQMDAAIAGLSAGVSEPHASLDSSRPRSFVSDSRFKELDEQERDVTEYSTPLTSPIIPNTAAVDRSNTTATAVPTVTLDKMDDLESNVEKQLYAMSASVGQAPQVPAHEDDQLPSPSKTHRSSISLQSTSFQDRSAADAIKSIYDHMTSKLMTGGPKSGNGTDEDRVLKVRDGFENFNGFGVKCVSDNEDEEKHTAPPSSTLK